MKKQNFLTKNYKASWEFFKQSKIHILVALIIFIVFTIIGFLFPVFFEQKIFELIKQLVEMFEGKNVYATTAIIFFNNIRASFFSMILGIFAGIFPLITAITNGYLLGFVANHTVKQEGILVLWRLLPHGIFELPAVIMSIGLGFKIGLSIFKPETIKNNLVEALRFFLFVILPLLIIAAIIEGILIFFIG